VGNCSQRIEYTYDELGNRLTENRVGGTGAGLITSTYNDKNQLTQTSRPGGLLQPPVVTTHGYDDNGNQTSAGTNTYSYDLENRLNSATIGSATTNYTYDGNGLRRTATTGGATTSYTWDTNNHLPELTAETTAGATRKFLNNASGDPVAITNPGTGTNTGLHYLHLDDLGSARAATDTGANVRGTYSYEPFGTSRTSPTNQNGLTNPVGFAGEYKDPATSLYHLRARELDTTTGRFTALDPIAQDITDPYVAEYAYTNNRPTVLTDPSGLCPWCAVAIGVAIAGAVYGAEVALTDEEFDLQRLAIEMAAGGIGAGVGYRVYKAGAGLATTRLSGAVTGSASAVAGETTYSLAAGHGLPSLEETLAALIFGGAAGCLMPPGAIGFPLGGTGAAKGFATGADDAVFWSGVGRGGDKVAAEWAAKHGGSTLETTMAARGISLPAWDASNPAVVAAWRDASAQFARGASGDVRVLQGDAVRLNSVWAQVEFPALKANTNVTSITAINPHQPASHR